MAYPAQIGRGSRHHENHENTNLTKYFKFFVCFAFSCVSWMLAAGTNSAQTFQGHRVVQPKSCAT
jgi:hypothetical protein